MAAGLGADRAPDGIATLEALESWCRRMADTLTGGGAIGLAQAIATTAARSTNRSRRGDRAGAPAARRRARPRRALREFADAVDDRVGDTVAAALLLALHQQSGGVAQVLRQLADGVARDVRARRDIEAARAESRQSIRMLLLIQAGLLGLLALVPGFAAPYRDPGRADRDGAAARRHRRAAGVDAPARPRAPAPALPSRSAGARR